MMLSSAEISVETANTKTASSGTEKKALQDEGVDAEMLQ